MDDVGTLVARVVGTAISKSRADATVSDPAVWTLELGFSSTRSTDNVVRVHYGT